MFKAAALQGRSEFGKVVDIAYQAKALNPKSQMAILMLADDLIRLDRFNEAQIVLEEAIEIYPNDPIVNICYARVLDECNVSINEIVPFVKKYIDATSKRLNKESNNYFDLWAETLARKCLNAKEA